MSKKNELRTKIIDTMITNAESEIERNTILVDFYEKHAEDIEDKEEKSKVLLKAKQIQDTTKFNEKFLEYIKSL